MIILISYVKIFSNSILYYLYSFSPLSLFSIFARGADGGNGLYHHPGGKGALVRAVFFLHEGDTIFMSIGQSGADACSSLNKVYIHIILFFLCFFLLIYIIIIIFSCLYL